LQTKDGGGVVKVQKLPSEGSTTDLSAISMADAFNGYIVGKGGLVLFTDREGVAEADIPTVKDYSNFSVYLDQALPLLIEGFVNMLRVIFISMIIGFVLGVGFALGKTVDSTPLNIIATIYTDFFRNTPLLVQIFVIHFGFPELGLDLTFGGSISRDFASSIVSLGLNSGAYQAEIIRSGIQAIPTGQMEAGRSVGLNYFEAMRYVILPQAIRVVIPPLGNEFVNLVLNSSLVSVAGYLELTRAGRLIIATTFLNFQTWLIVALFYFVVTYTLTNLLRYAEKKTKIPGLGLGER
jgi:polar amino acid transport system permease protein